MGPLGDDCRLGQRLVRRSRFGRPWSFRTQVALQDFPSGWRHSVRHNRRDWFSSINDYRFNSMDNVIQGRLPKYLRAPERFGKMQLTAQDIEILALVYSYRHLWADHVRALLGRSPRNVARRLQALFHHGYLLRMVPPSQIRFALGSPKMIYALDLRGAQALATASGFAVNELGWNKTYNRRMEWFVEHQVAISHFRAVLALATDRAGLELSRWSQRHDLRDWDRVRSPQGDRTVRVSPDAYCAVRESGILRNFFLELDRGTEEHRRLRSKFLGYWHYLRGDRYRARYENAADVRVLVVTTSQKRLRRMQQTLASVDPRGRGANQFWFATQGQYNLHSPASILAAIWRVGASTAPERALFQRAT